MQYSRLHSLQPQRKKSHKKRTTKKLFRSSVGVLLLAGIGFLVLGHLHYAPSQTTSAKVEAAAINIPPSKYSLNTVTLPENGQGAIAVSEESLNIHSNGNNVWPMASITKIVTTMAILKKAPLAPGQTGENFTLTQKDEQYYWDYAAKQGTITPVTAGYDMNVYEILQTMLLASSNNMTDSLVDRYFSSHEEYVNYANDMLHEMGLTRTKVADASGFSPESVSTPSEMIKIGQTALKNPVIAEIVRQPSASPRVAGLIPNYNALINQPGVTGIKPGMTDQSGHNLLFSFETPNKTGENVTVIGVVMGIFDRGDYMKSLMAMYDTAKAAASEQ